MSSVIIAGDTSGTVTLAAPAVSGTTTLTLPATSGTLLQSGTAVTVAQGGTGLTTVGTSGNLLTSNGTAWVSSAPAASGGMTLLGTITPTVANSISLGSLTLTSYKALFVSFTSLVPSAANFIYVNSSSVQSGMLIYAGLAGASGAFWLDLATGTGGGGCAYIPTDVGATGGSTSISTATTTLYFRLASTATFAASGSIKIYGVA